MKILQVFDMFSLSYGGGTVDIMSKLSKALIDRGHEVEICTSDCKLDRVAGLNFKVYRSWLNLPGIRVTPSIIKLDVRDYDVIHLHCYRSFQNAVIYHKAIKHGIPYIIDAHGSTVDFKDAKLPLRKLFDNVVGYKALKNAHHLIAETEVGASEYERLGVPKERVVLLHPFFGLEEFKNLPQRGLLREKYSVKEKFIVLFLGRIHWAKGIEYLLESVNKLGRSDIKLVVVGQDDGFQAKLESIASGYSMKVLFTGYLGGLDKLSALVDADVLVQPSMNEAGARPSLEAILCNTPVIVTRDNGAGQEIAKMDAGCLVDYGDSQQLSRAIQYVLQKRDETYAQTQKARKYIMDNLSLERQVVQYEQLYGG